MCYPLPLSLLRKITYLADACKSGLHFYLWTFATEIPQDKWVNNTYLSIWCKKVVKSKCVLRHVYRDFYCAIAFLVSNNITIVKSISVHSYVYTIGYYETHKERGYRGLFIDTEITSSFTGKYRWYLLKFFLYIFLLIQIILGIPTLLFLPGKFYGQRSLADSCVRGVAGDSYMT